MKEKLIITNTIVIKADPKHVWDHLTLPENTRKYMFGCETVSDWKEGSTLLWKGMWEGQEMVFVKGVIVTIRPPEYLVYTTIDPNSTLPDLPENYLTVTYSLSPDPEGTRLTVTQGDYAQVGNGDARYDESIRGGGWEPILRLIKELAEQDTGKTDE
jgi:uncharacterized protein YndB with AHSA1/START domain